jgi:hypothetical protein
MAGPGERQILRPRETPSASIVIPTRNRPLLLRRAVASALAECGAGDQVLVADDGSFRPARSVLGDFDDPRLRVLASPGPRGVSGARNHAVASAGGSHVFFLDDDDVFVAGYVGRILALLASGAAADYGYAFRVEAPDGTRPIDRQRVPGGPIPPRAALRRRIGATSAGFWIRRDVFLALGGFDTAQQVDEDTDLCVRLVISAHRGWFEATTATRVRQEDVTAEGEAGQLTRVTPHSIVAACYLRTHDKSFQRFPLAGRARWYLAARYIRRAVKAGQAEAAESFANRPEHGPLRPVLWSYVRLRSLIERRRRAAQGAAGDPASLEGGGT